MIGGWKLAESGLGGRGIRNVTAAAFGALALLGAGAARAEEAPAVRLSATYTGEVWRNAQGGIRRGSVYLENLEVGLEVDAERTLGWRGATLKVSGFHNDDSTLSDRFVGDIQAISGKDATGGTRLYEAWMRQAFGPGVLKAGVIDLNTEFSVNATGLIFVNGAQGLGLDLAQVGRNGPSVFPATGLGLVGEALIGGHWSVKLGVFDGVPRDSARPRGGTFRLGMDEGALVIGEVSHGAQEETRFAVGLWGHTAKFDALGGPVSQDSSMGGYVLAEQPLARWGRRRLDGFARLGFADPKIEQIAATYSAGLVLKGPILGFDDEALGVGVTVAQNGRQFRRAQAALGTPVELRETALELTYRAQVTSWLALQPDLQYVINPGADPALKNALVAGLRFEVTWSGPSGR
jgi:porin